jgi:phosphatidylglycerophosphatase A
VPDARAPAEQRSALDQIAFVIATGFGTGLAPIAPGTVASAATLAALWVVSASALAIAVFAVVATIVGTWAADRAERLLGEKDPGAIVIDEVAGMALSLMLFPMTPAVLASAFVLFRVFDIVKPAPARQSQALPGGLGIMVDDLIAGAYVILVLILAHVTFGWP